jgi:raffinose/stachyose/melibiose transport system permease protein
MIGRNERLLNYFVLCSFMAIVLFPVLWFVLTALSPNLSGRIDLTNIAWGNFTEAWHVGGFGNAMRASLVITASAVAGQTVLAILSGYAFGVLGVAGERFFFPLILLGLMVSTEAIIVALYYQFRSIGLTDSWFGLILVHIGMGVPFGMFWMRATFRAIPISLIESARLDGANSWRILWRILVPVSRPAILTLVLLSFMWTWNDFFLSLVFISDPDRQPATLALGSFQGMHSLQVNYLAAASLIVSVPVLLLYLIFQRQFISGVMSGSIKE